MFLKAKTVALLGMFTAVTVLLISLGSIIEMNTLFFLAAASFLVGVAVREYGLMTGSVFYAACVILGFFVAPNKLYCFTYAAFGIYILLVEFIFVKVIKVLDSKRKKSLFWILKLIVFNVIYIPSLILYPKLFTSIEVTEVVFVGILIAGQVALVIFDKAYDYFQYAVWGRIRGKIQR